MFGVLCWVFGVIYVWYLVFNVWCLVFGVKDVWYLVFDVWFLVLGVKNVGNRGQRLGFMVWSS